MSLFFSVWLKNLKETIDPRNLPFLTTELIRFGRDSRTFRRRYVGNYPIKSLPVLFDGKSHSTFDAQYVYQAYWATRKILKTNDSGYHVDISSHIPFVAQLSAHVRVMQMELIPPPVYLPSLEKLSGSLVHLPFRDGSVSSLSCLHVIEHVGLGRYGDPVDGDGCWKALRELRRVVAPGGHCFLSIPVGKEAIHFNAGYVFRACDIVDAVDNFELIELSVVNEEGYLEEAVPLQRVEKIKHALGLFHLRRR